MEKSEIKTKEELAISRIADGIAQLQSLIDEGVDIVKDIYIIVSSIDYTDKEKVKIIKNMFNI